MENGKASTAADQPASLNAKKRSRPNIFSVFFLWWMCPVLIRGNRRDVVEDDLIIPNKRYDSETVGSHMERYWFEECERAVRKNRKPSLLWAICRAHWVSFMPGAIYISINSIARTCQPMLFTVLLTYWSADATLTQQEASIYAVGMLGLMFISMMSTHHNSLFVSKFGMKIKIACSSILYRKLLRMKQTSLGDIAGGKLVNLLSNDVARFDYAFMFLHNLWVIPIQVAVVMYFLYEAAGYAPFIGLFSVVIIITPIQAGLTKLTSVVRRETASRTDSRIKLMNEIISGIQVIKMYAWEKPFQVVVAAARVFELKSLRKAIFIRSTFLGFTLFSERLILLITTLALSLTGTLVTATVIYPIQQYFSLIQWNLTIILPFAISQLAEMKVSIERIQSFLELDERDDLNETPAIKTTGNDNLSFNMKDINGEAQGITPVRYSLTEGLARRLSKSAELSPRRASIEGEYIIEVSKVNASWTYNKSELTLKNISMRVRKGKLCAVIGPVGSGKTSFLHVLLKELPVIDGSFNVKGRVSYACQESWLFPGTVRENIVFGLPYAPQKYKEVCRVCSLLPDFKQFPYGDLSLVGERGVSLSGGQRARITLARAIYRDVDVYLLDDPLSAVDANVGRLLFDDCIKTYLRGKTCILVTHQIHYLKAADQIVVMNEGTIESMGTYDELINAGKEFSMLLARQESKNEDIETERPNLQRGMSRKLSEKGDEAETQELQVQGEEERAKGNLDFNVLTRYFGAVQSVFVVLMTLGVLIMTQALGTFGDYWLSYWTNQVDAYEQSLPAGTDPDTSMDAQIGLLTTAEYLYVFGGIVLALILFSQFRILSFVYMIMRASKYLHNVIYEKLIITVMRFFDTNPSGRVLNRFSKDMGGMDEMMPRSMLETIQMYLSMISILTLNAIALPWTLVPTTGLLVIFVFLLRWYLNAAQAVKRLEGTTKSPVFGMINSTISGLTTIRSFESQDRLLNNFDAAQDLHTSAFYTFIGGSTAFGMYLDALCIVYLGAIMAIFLFVDFGVAVGSVGLAVSQSLVLTMLLQMAARNTAEFLGQMTSVERVLEYTQLPIEDNIEDGPTQPPKDWPSKGHVQFENVSLQYALEDPPVLKNLNFEFQSGWKVGVVGRTGAGKSSLISALFRLYNLEGHIKIDGINTIGVAKRELRSKISIIPQVPVLFSATMRYNLDPFNTYNDDDIWRALEQVELKDAVPALDYQVSEGGSNFSMGQRQLICLARAILRSNKILVMDEATANVDPQTDALIQKTIRREFSSCTVITIAHRLNTIMDSDRVLVMDKGVAAEFDHPYILLSNPNSIFSFMVRETGQTMAKVLLEVAKTKYESMHDAQTS